jgi:hypothetical protein
MGLLKKSDFTPLPTVQAGKSPKGGFIICWISISLPSPSRSRYGEARPGGFRGEIKRVDFFNIPIIAI